MAETLKTEVLVIGGGATGAGVAWDCALRGYDTILAERKDLAEGTSGRFHGLLHSGGRYAVKDPDAAVECIEENVILRRIAADCIEDTGGLFVVTPDDDPEYGDRFLEGCRATVLEEVDADHGMIKMDGELWQARSFDGTEKYLPGERVRVIKVDGATAIVWRDGLSDL